ncbi:bifunctional coenzyme A synthase isoform X2 [Halyomorpha halys]|uniref:bifunctional coenzyme A synthase isoform X2 n=1 Tax=Halyomorpha halys TaxID=286706 RepID=UPI0006D4F5CD|nr:bifunctional coenzyme A synthase isoform X2 [Halyomorpha halys]
MAKTGMLIITNPSKLNKLIPRIRNEVKNTLYVQFFPPKRPGINNAKKLWELIQPCSLRMDRVRDFLEDIDPNLEYNIIPINDMFGPTKDDPTFEMIVVSSETVGGGKKVNELRVSNGLKALQVLSVELIPDIKLDEEEEDKISSSNDRLRLLGTLITQPEPRPHIPSQPYVIGLTGGIASGKSSVCGRLKLLGAGTVDCDKIAHELYLPGTPIYSQLIEIFGSTIIGDDGIVNRKVLGQMVFNDKTLLEKLNNLLWPSILERSKQLSIELFKKGYNVVILEAAILIPAGWHEHCHEVWSCIIPQEEAIKRLINRNGLSVEEATSRLHSQPSNVLLVNNANVVFCTLWRPEYTQKQVEKAWKELHERISS